MNDTQKQIQTIKENTTDYEMFEKIIYDGLHLYPEKPTDQEIADAIDNYLWDLYKNSGAQWVDAWDERHRENVWDYIEAEREE